MLKELIENLPIPKNITAQNFLSTLNADFVSFIHENCGINLSQNNSNLISAEIEKFVDAIKFICEKISANSNLSQNNKSIVINNVMARLFDIWRKSDSAELFFIKITQKFNPAQIVSALAPYVKGWEKHKWVMNFFAENKKLLPQKNKKIRTVGIYYLRIFNGGIERMISLMIPEYIKLGYRVILFTDLSKPEMEYPLPPPSENFAHVTFSKPLNATFERLDELATLLKKYEVDLLISHARGASFPPYLQFLFFKLSGIKIVMQLHGSIKHSDFRFPNLLSYPISDAMVVMSRARMKFLKNFGVNAFYIPNPSVIENADKFKGRDPKNVSNKILWVGRIDLNEKKPFSVIPIIKEVKAKIPNVKLKILGTAENNATLEKFRQLIQANNLESNIEFCGFHTDTSNFYIEADLILNTSPHEGWSLVIAESKFYELPLVLYELPDNELTADGKGCIAVPKDDSRAAADAITKILTDAELRCKLSAQARESLQPFLNYDIAGAWQKLFESLENAEQVTPDIEMATVQNILLEEIFYLKDNVQKLSAQIKTQGN